MVSDEIEPYRRYWSTEERTVTYCIDEEEAKLNGTKA